MDICPEGHKSRSYFISYLEHWFRGRQTPENIPVPPPNDPRHLPPPSQFVSLASATVHPTLAIPSIGRSNNCFIRLAAAFYPQPAALQSSHPFSVSAFLTEPSYYRPRSDLFQRNRTTLPRPPPSTRSVSTEHLCPGPLHCHRGAPAESPKPFSTPTCYPRAALLRSPPTTWRMQPPSRSRSG